MATRDPKQQILPSVRGRVTSRVVDQYFKPQVEPVVSQASKELVQSLGSVIPSLQRLDKQRYEFEAEDNKIEGSKAQSLLKKNFKQAVADGDIPEGANPYFVIGYNQLEVKDLGKKFISYIKDEYAQNQGQFLDDPNPDVLNNFIDEKLDAWSVENNVWGYDSKTVLENFEPSVNGVRSELNSILSSQRLGVMSTKFNQIFGSQIVNDIEEADNLVVPEDYVGSDTDYRNNVIALKINQKINEFRDVKDIVALNTETVASIIAYAKENLDEDILDIAKLLKTSGDSSLYDIPKYTTELENAYYWILSKQEKDRQDRKTRDKDIRNEKIQTGKDSFVEWYDSQAFDGNVPSSQETQLWLLENNLNTINELATFVKSYENAYDGQALKSDKDTLESFNRLIVLNPYDETIIDQLERALEAKEINATDFKNFKNELQDQRNGADAKFLDNEIYTNLLNLGQRTLLKGEAFQQINPSLGSGAFQISFTKRARVISNYIDATYGDLPEFEREQKFIALIEQEYSRQLNNYFKAVETDKFDEDAETSLQNARLISSYPVKYNQPLNNSTVDYTMKTVDAERLELSAQTKEAIKAKETDLATLTEKIKNPEEELTEEEQTYYDLLPRQLEELIIQNEKYLYEPVKMSSTLQEGGDIAVNIPTVGNESGTQTPIKGTE